MSDKKHVFVKKGNLVGNLINDDVERLADELNAKFRQKIIDLHRKYIMGQMSQRDFEKESQKVLNEMAQYILEKHLPLVAFMRDENINIGFEIDMNEIMDDFIQGFVKDMPKGFGNCGFDKFDD